MVSFRPDRAGRTMVEHYSKLELLGVGPAEKSMSVRLLEGVRTRLGAYQISCQAIAFGSFPFARALKMSDAGLASDMLRV